MSRGFLFIVVLFFAAAISAAPIRIACVGDSITEGSGLANPALEAYPPRLQRLLGTNYTVMNYGVSGRTLLKKGDFPYWNEAAFTNSRTFNPDIVIIQLGTNDGKPYNWIYGTNFVTDYKALIAIYQALPSAPKVYLCSPCPVYGSGAYDINPGVVRTNIAPAVRALASELGLPLIDLQARMTNSTWFPDTVHPDSKGMTAMAAVMFEGLAGGPPDEAPPALDMQRTSLTRFILSWPAKWGGLVPETTTTLFTNRWSVIEASLPYTDGTTIRQTNLLASPTLRLFQLARP
jgi:acyl-CoA thioesterase-1